MCHVLCLSSEDDQDCDRSCELPDFSRGKRSVDSSLASGKKRRRRTITRTLYDSDRGPIEFLDGAGNLIQLERELQKPSRSPPTILPGVNHVKRIQMVFYISGHTHTPSGMFLTFLSRKLKLTFSNSHCGKKIVSFLTK